MSFDIELYIAAWLNEYPNGHLPRGFDSKVQAFKDLLVTFKNLGMTKEEALSYKNRIVSNTVNPHLKDKNRLKAWSDMNNRAYVLTIAIVWSDELIIEKTEIELPKTIDERFVILEERANQTPEEDFDMEQSLRDLEVQEKLISEIRSKLPPEITNMTRIEMSDEELQMMLSGGGEQ